MLASFSTPRVLFKLMFDKDWTKIIWSKLLVAKIVIWSNFLLKIFLALIPMGKINQELRSSHLPLARDLLLFAMCSCVVVTCGTAGPWNSLREIHQNITLVVSNFNTFITLSVKILFECFINFHFKNIFSAFCHGSAIYN